MNGLFFFFFFFFFNGLKKEEKKEAVFGKDKTAGLKGTFHLAGALELQQDVTHRRTTGKWNGKAAPVTSPKGRGVGVGGGGWGGSGETCGSGGWGEG